MAKDIQIRPLSSLAKVFPSKIIGKKCTFGQVAAGQEISFQVAYRLNRDYYTKKAYRVEVTLGDDIKVSPELFDVKYVPSFFVAYPMAHDKNYITTESGYFPDPLVPMDNGDKVYAVSQSWQSLWISLRIPSTHAACEDKITVRFIRDKNGEVVEKCTFLLRINTASLPTPTLSFTQWIHYDCIADVHGVKVFSEAHWTLIEKYLRLAALHGVNLVLTPILTPPLDTAVGGERTTVQLVDIEYTNGEYSFDFSKLTRFVRLVKQIGIDSFEINHMFTQWGATCCPKVVAKVNGRNKKIFGWHTSATSEEYKNFLSKLIPALITHFNSLGITNDHIIFHVSDEPGVSKHFDSYSAAANILMPLIKGCKHMDAMSDIEFYSNGLVDIPVAAIGEPVMKFIENGAEELWCYYCCSQSVDLSNRFFAMPSARTRMIGVQMYKYGVKGFLHWGYNFYNSHLSLKKLDPWSQTDADNFLPGGDSFSVYPYKDDVIPSLRLKVFANALEDVRLLTLVEQKIGRENTIRALDELAGGKLTFTEYPTDEAFFDRLYEFVFGILKK